MIPDGFLPFAGRHFLAGLLVCSLVVAAVAPLRRASPTGPPAQDALTRSGFEHYYDLDYDGAVSDFERALKAHPDDPFAVNHLLSAVFYRELYRVGVLDTGLYSSNSFLVKKNLPFDPKVRAEANQRPTGRCGSPSSGWPRTARRAGALRRGLSRALRAEYMALVDKAWLAALRNAIGARRDHEDVSAGAGLRRGQDHRGCAQLRCRQPALGE